MIKWLLVVGVISAIYIFFIKKKPVITKEGTSSNDVKNNSSEMVKCSTCSVYCELNDTILSANKYYCSSECLEKS